MKVGKGECKRRGGLTKRWKGGEGEGEGVGKGEGGKEGKMREKKWAGERKRVVKHEWR